MFMRKRFYRTSAIFLILFLSFSARAERIAIIGTGNVAGALGPEFAGLGHDVIYGSRSPERDDVILLVKRTGSGASASRPKVAAASADVIVLAVPGELVREITLSLGDLSGKIVIDPTNPLSQGENDQMILETSSSNAEVIQEVAPGAFVVKAFSTLNVRQMVDPESSGGPISIIMAGNDEDAKSFVSDLANGMGLDPIDVGPIENARYIEGMLIIWLNNRISDRQRFEYHLRKIPD